MPLNAVYGVNSEGERKIYSSIEESVAIKQTGECVCVIYLLGSQMSHLCLVGLRTGGSKGT